MATDRIKGSITALATPFKGGAFDREAYAALIERQIEAGTHGLVPAGTTGESATLSIEEHVSVIGTCVAAAKGRVPVIAGVGSNNTVEAIRLAESATAAGADALLALTGYYNKPPQDGLYAHFEALHEATDLPIIVYNVPGRTASDIAVPTLGKLARCERIVGVKDATGELGRVARQRLACGADFIQLSGEDLTAVGFNAMGGRGCISVLSNVAPKQCAAMQEATLEGRFEDAVQIQDRLAPLADALFSETSPVPVKYALSKLGLCTESVRLPLIPASARARRLVDEAMAGLDL